MGHQPVQERSFRIACLERLCKSPAWTEFLECTPSPKMQILCPCKRCVNSEALVIAEKDLDEYTIQMIPFILGKLEPMVEGTNQLCSVETMSTLAMFVTDIKLLLHDGTIWTDVISSTANWAEQFENKVFEHNKDTAAFRAFVELLFDVVAVYTSAIKDGTVYCCGGGTGLCDCELPEQFNNLQMFPGSSVRHRPKPVAANYLYKPISHTKDLAAIERLQNQADTELIIYLEREKFAVFRGRMNAAVRKQYENATIVYSTRCIQPVQLWNFVRSCLSSRLFEKSVRFSNRIKVGFVLKPGVELFKFIEELTKALDRARQCIVAIRPITD